MSRLDLPGLFPICGKDYLMCLMPVPLSFGSSGRSSYHKGRTPSLVELSEDLTSALSNQLLRFSISAQISLLLSFRRTFPAGKCFFKKSIKQRACIKSSFLFIFSQLLVPATERPPTLEATSETRFSVALNEANLTTRCEQAFPSQHLLNSFRECQPYAGLWDTMNNCFWFTHSVLKDGNLYPLSVVSFQPKCPNLASISLSGIYSKALRQLFPIFHHLWHPFLHHFLLFSRRSDQNHMQCSGRIYQIFFLLNSFYNNS